MKTSRYVRTNKDIYSKIFGFFKKSSLAIIIIYFLPLSIAILQNCLHNNYIRIYEGKVILHIVIAFCNAVQGYKERYPDIAKFIFILPVILNAADYGLVRLFNVPNKIGLRGFKVYQMTMLFTINIIIFGIMYFMLSIDGAQFWVRDHWTASGLGIWDALYFSAVTATTLGYGDIYTNHILGKCICTMEAVLTVTAVAVAINIVSQDMKASR